VFVLFSLEEGPALTPEDEDELFGSIDLEKLKIDLLGADGGSNSKPSDVGQIILLFVLLDLFSLLLRHIP
jgi:hypothetical protein